MAVVAVLSSCGGLSESSVSYSTPGQPAYRQPPTLGLWHGLVPPLMSSFPKFYAWGLTCP